MLHAQILKYMYFYPILLSTTGTCAGNNLEWDCRVDYSISRWDTRIGKNVMIYNIIAYICT